MFSKFKFVWGEGARQLMDRLKLARTITAGRVCVHYDSLMGTSMFVFLMSNTTKTSVSLCFFERLNRPADVRQMSFL